LLGRLLYRLGGKFMTNWLTTLHLQLGEDKFVMT
jgi:hypothetical protein